MRNYKNKALNVFESKKKNNIEAIKKDKRFSKNSLQWMIESEQYRYVYNFRWMGVPIIKYPNDIVAIQEIIWETKPDLVIETGVAHGGSVVFIASILNMVNKKSKIIGIDLEIRKHNLKEIQKNIFYKKNISLIEGSSTDPKIVRKIKSLSKGKKVMVILDSAHSHSHVLDELRIYSKIVSKNQFLIVEDTFEELYPKDFFQHLKSSNVRPNTNKGNNPMTALKEFLQENKDFSIDNEFNKKLGITQNIDSYLKKIK